MHELRAKSILDRPIRFHDFMIKNCKIHNLTGAPLDPNLEQVIGLGLKFCPTPHRLDNDTIMKACDKMARAIRIKEMFKESDNKTFEKRTYVPNSTFIPKTASDAIEKALKITIEAARSIPTKISNKRNLSRHQWEVLESFKKQDRLRIVYTDKNLGPAIMLTEEYKKWCLDHLAQDSIYKPSNISLNNIKDQVYEFLTQHAQVLSKLGRDAQIISFNLTSTKLAHFYGIVKLHKENRPIRPIVACYNTPTTGLSKWLTVQLEWTLSLFPNILKNSQELISIVHNITPHTDDEWFTVDVEKMYTAIPQDMLLEVLKDLLQHEEKDLGNMIIAAAKLVISNNVFTFGDTTWKQTRGLAMGHSCSPTLATIFVNTMIDHCNQRTFGHCKLLKIYLDDLLICFNNEGKGRESLQFQWDTIRRRSGLNLIATKHSKDDIVYLDLTIFQCGSSYHTKTYEKGLSLYQYTTFNSAHPTAALKSLVTGTIQKLKLQNSRTADFNKNVKKFFQRLSDRGFLDTTIKPIFLDCLKNHTSDIQEEDKMVPLIIPFDPNGLNNSQLRKGLQLEQLEAATGRRIVLALKQPRNLGALVGKQQLTLERTLLKTVRRATLPPAPLTELTPNRVTISRQHSEVEPLNEDTSDNTRKRTNYSNTSFLEFPGTTIGQAIETAHKQQARSGINHVTDR